MRTHGASRGDTPWLVALAWLVVVVAWWRGCSTAAEGNESMQGYETHEVEVGNVMWEVDVLVNREPSDGRVIGVESSPEITSARWAATGAPLTEDEMRAVLKSQPYPYICAALEEKLTHADH